MRFQYAYSKTRERLEAILEDGFASGEISLCERPDIEPVYAHAFKRGTSTRRVVGYALTLEG